MQAHSPLRVGILSDTHSHRVRARLCNDWLVAQGVNVVVHAGDIGSEGILFDMVEAFTPINVPVFAVLGNVDEHQPEIRNFPASTGVVVAQSHRLTLAGLPVAVIHGHDPLALRRLLADESLAVVISGHTHRRSDIPGSPRSINPGAVFRSEEPGCALLDLDSGLLRYFDLL